MLDPGEYLILLSYRFGGSILRWFLHQLTQAAAAAAAGAYGWGRAQCGSRNHDGNVPNVNWNDGKLNVNWYNPDNANANLRARQAVSDGAEL